MGIKKTFVTSNLGHIVSIIRLYFIENEQFFEKLVIKYFTTLNVYPYNYVNLMLFVNIYGMDLCDPYHNQ
jgi:hypothetical protein